MKFSLDIAADDDIPDVVSIKNEAAQKLTDEFGKGHWSYQCTEKGVRGGVNENSKLFVAKIDGTVVGTARLTTKKPWAIDPAYFSKVDRAIYLVDMAVHPDHQRKGIGKKILEKIVQFAEDWPAQSIRLDAYNAKAGAGDFYKKCGYTEKGRVIYRGTRLIYYELEI